MFQRILIAISEREPAGREVAVGAELATALGARVALVHVVETSLAATPEAGLPAAELLADLQRTGQAFLRATRARLPAGLAAEEFLREGKPADEILTVARQWGADLIIIGVQHHTALGQLLHHTVETIVRQARCAILTVPPEAAPA